MRNGGHVGGERDPGQGEATGIIEIDRVQCRPVLVALGFCTPGMLRFRQPTGYDSHAQKPCH